MSKFLAAALAFGLLAGACGGDDDTAAPEETTTTTVTVEDVTTTSTSAPEPEPEPTGWTAAQRSSLIEELLEGVPTLTRTQAECTVDYLAGRYAYEDVAGGLAAAFDRQEDKEAIANCWGVDPSSFD